MNEMALIKCPDCEKMISERVPNCPFCGCPAEFFNKEINDKAETESMPEVVIDKSGETEKEQKNVEKQELSKDEIYAEFNILGKRIVYHKKDELWIQCLRYHNAMAAKIEIEELWKRYDAAKDINKVFDELIPFAEGFIDVMIEENVKFLYKLDILISKDEYRKKNGISMWNFMDDVSAAYDKVIEASRELQQQKQMIRSTRSRWYGGGFGIGGAIKGAIKAGAMNMVTDAGRSIVDSVSDSSDRAATNRDLKSIYENNEYKREIMSAFRMCAALVDVGLLRELGFEQHIDMVQAWKIYSAAATHENNQRKFAERVVDAIILYPIEKTFYGSVLFEAYDNEIDDLCEFLQFWNLHIDENVFLEAAESRKPQLEYLEEHPEIQKIDFKRFDPDTYIKVRDAKLALEAVSPDHELSALINVCNKIEDYMMDCLDKVNALNSIKVLKDLQDSDSAEEFMGKIHVEKSILPGLLKGIWVYGDSEIIPEEKIKNKWKLSCSEKIYMYQNTAIFGTAFGGKGFVLTDRTLCDLGSKNKISIANIDGARYEEESSTIYVKEGNTNIAINLKEESPASRLFLYCCLEEYVNRYANFTEDIKYPVGQSEIEDTKELVCDSIQKQDEQHNIKCPHCNGEIDRNAKFCCLCGKAIKAFGESNGVLQKKYCENCGEEIDPGTKFCNFCGAKVEE